MAFPKIDVCIVCEGVRQEILSKHTLLGFFGISPHVRIGIKNFGLPLAICFVFCGGEGEGKFKLQLRITDSSGATIPNAMQSVVEGELRKGIPTTTVFFLFQGVVGKPGDYRASLLVDNQEHYSAPFKVGPFEENQGKDRLN
jgi:uncharacterized protein DUF6941